MIKKSELFKKLDKKLDLPKSILPKDIFSTRYILGILLALVFLAVIINLRYSDETFIEPTTTTIRQTTTTTTYTPTTTLPTIPQKSTGKLVVALKDEEHKLPGGTIVKSMNFTLTKVSVYSDDGKWVEVFSGAKVLNLLDYTDTLAIVAEANIEEGTYEKLKLGLSDGSIWITNTFLYIYTPKKYIMAVPTEKTVDHIFKITPDDTLTLILDFDIESSVSRTGEGYLMDPKISVVVRSGVPDNVIKI